LILGIRERTGFVRLRRHGVRLRNDPLWCSYVHDPAVTPPQVAFAIGRAVGPAVTRNRVRRRLKAILSHAEVPSGLFLVGATVQVNELTFDQLRVNLLDLMERAGDRYTP
jgi:ribonuclease P protein component